MIDMGYYYTPLQRKGQKFFEEYIPADELFDSAFAPDTEHIIDRPPKAPKIEGPKEYIVYEGLRRIASTPYGRGLLISAAALSYLPLLEKTQTSKTYDEGELMFIQSGAGGALIV